MKVIEIKMHRGFVALIDACDSDLSEGGGWYAFIEKNRNTPHVRRHVKGTGRKNQKKEHLHRLVLSRILGRALLPHEEVDRIDGDGLNNRRKNLRLASRGENSRNIGRRKDNISGYKGVSWNSQRRKWQAAIHYNGKFYHLGFFSDPKDGHEAYCQKAVELHGEFARVN